MLYYKAACKLGLKVPAALDPQPMEGHVTAAQIAAEMGVDEFQSYFSFAIVRNPWDWQVSLYTFASKSTRHRQHQLVAGFADFNEYLRWRCREEVRFQKSYLYSTEGEQLVDFIGRYENLEADFQSICRRIGVEEELPVLNVSKTKPYQEYYTPETRELVRKIFAPDIETFHYTFE
jgi:hypothetical protein